MQEFLIRYMSYTMLPRTIWRIFSEIFTFCCLFWERLTYWNNNTIWETRKIFVSLCEGNLRKLVSLLHEKILYILRGYLYESRDGKEGQGRAISLLPLYVSFLNFDWIARQNAMISALPLWAWSCISDDSLIFSCVEYWWHWSSKLKILV